MNPFPRALLGASLVACATVLGGCGASTVSPDAGNDPVDAGGGEDARSDTGTKADGGSCVAHTGGTQVVTCNGLSVTVTAPATCPAAGCGLVLDVHGFLMDADVEDAMTHLRALAIPKGYVVVQPTAPSGRVPQGPAWLDSDDAAVWASVQDVQRAFPIDPHRLHVTGLSQGGFMTFRLFCAHSDVIASAAPALAGTANCPASTLNGSCPFTSGSPATKRPLLYMVGTKDALVPASCTDPERDAIVTGWGLGAKAPVASGTGWRRDRYTGTGVTLDLVSHDGTASGALVGNAGHCVPGGGPSAPGIWSGLRCDGVTGLDWGTEVVTFFDQNPKP